MSLSIDKIAEEFNLSLDTDDRKNVFISFGLLKLLSLAVTILGIVSIIINAIHRFGTTDCNLLELMNLAAFIESLTSSGNNSLAIQSLDQKPHLLISLF